MKDRKQAERAKYLFGLFFIPQGFSVVQDSYSHRGGELFHPQKTILQRSGQSPLIVGQKAGLKKAASTGNQSRSLAGGLNRRLCHF